MKKNSYLKNLKKADKYDIKVLDSYSPLLSKRNLEISRLYNQVNCIFESYTVSAYLLSILAYYIYYFKKNQFEHDPEKCKEKQVSGEMIMLVLYKVKIHYDNTLSTSSIFKLNGKYVVTFFIVCCLLFVVCLIF